MDSFKSTSVEAVPAVVNNLAINKTFIINVVAIACGLALVVFASVATSDLDLSAGFF